MASCPICGSAGDDLAFKFYCSNQGCANYEQTVTSAQGSVGDSLKCPFAIGIINFQGMHVCYSPLTCVMTESREYDRNTDMCTITLTVLHKESLLEVPDECTIKIIDSPRFAGGFSAVKNFFRLKDGCVFTLDIQVGNQSMLEFWDLESWLSGIRAYN